MKKNFKLLVISALFAALACVATLSIRIPTPGTNGYIHPGDAIVILSGVFLGPVYGLLAGGIGSALADLTGGYLLYAPITFIIKGLVAFISGLIFSKAGKNPRSRYLCVGLGGVADLVLVAGGYYCFESVIYGAAGALGSVPSNMIQGAGGLVLSLLLYPVLAAVPDLRQLAQRTHEKSN
ncbi:ECF transporter S component [Lachnospiraceae bacterium LCP19S3_B12]